MAKKFTKLSLSDIVATSGGKSFRKLSTELPTPNLPEWNGTDLKGTSWDVLSGWSAISGYGRFNVYGDVTYQNGNIVEIPMEGFCVGYSFKDTGFGIPEPSSQANTICLAWYLDIPNTERFTVNFTGGADVTNTSLISWLKQYGKLTSHSMPEATLISFTILNWTYQAEDGMTWEVWVNSSYNTDGYFISGTSVVANAGSKVAFNGVKVTATELIKNGQAYGLYAEGFEW